jgi:hypothetical protein
MLLLPGSMLGLLLLLRLLLLGCPLCLQLADLPQILQPLHHRDLRVLLRGAVRHDSTNEHNADSANLLWCGTPWIPRDQGLACS